MGVGVYHDPMYRANRRLLLEDEPLCHWCQLRPATSADHVLAVADGGTNDLDNMVAACGPCNSRRGGRVGHRRRAELEGRAPPRPRRAFVVWSGMPWDPSHSGMATPPRGAVGLDQHA